MKKFAVLVLMSLLVVGAVFANGGTEETAMDSDATAANLAASKAIDISDVKGSDGQLLLIYGDTRPVPAKPASGEALDMWKLEYAGRQTEKLPMIESPGDGVIGKNIIMIQQSEHPYWTAVSNGSRIACEAYGATFEVWNPNGA